VSLSKVLEQAIAMSEKGIADKNIEVQTDFADVPPVAIDAAMMADAFINIIRNAVEASNDNGKIQVTLRYTYESDQSVAIEVTDNGNGIDEIDMPHIFNPFFTRKNYGTGLGLSLVKKIIDIHQGTIDIFSKKNEGTKVLIILPVGTEGARSTITNNE
jgi:signal transduction histidine kinase